MHGEFDGDGKSETMVIRHSIARWFAQSQTAASIIQTFAAGSDLLSLGPFVLNVR